MQEPILEQAAKVNLDQEGERVAHCGPSPWQGGAEIDEQKAWMRAYPGRDPQEPPHIKTEKSGFIKHIHVRDAPCLRSPAPEARGEDGKRYRKYNPWKPVRINGNNFGGKAKEKKRDILTESYTCYHGCYNPTGKRIKCSIHDRERGYKHKSGDLPKELSYPAMCAASFPGLPHFKWMVRSSDKETKHLHNVYRHLGSIISLNQISLGSRKTVEKRMGAPNSHWTKISDRYFMDKGDLKRLEYDPCIFKLLKDSPSEGWHAVSALNGINPKYTKPTYKDLGKYLSGCSDRFNDREESNSERSDWLELLNRYGIIESYLGYYFRRICGEHVYEDSATGDRWTDRTLWLLFGSFFNGWALY